MSNRKPAKYTVTVIEGNEPLTEQVIQQVAKILLESKRKREEENYGEEISDPKLGNRTGDGMPGDQHGGEILD